MTLTRGVFTCSQGGSLAQHAPVASSAHPHALSEPLRLTPDGRSLLATQEPLDWPLMQAALPSFTLAGAAGGVGGRFGGRRAGAGLHLSGVPGIERGRRAGRAAPCGSHGVPKASPPSLKRDQIDRLRVEQWVAGGSSLCCTLRHSSLMLDRRERQGHVCVHTDRARMGMGGRLGFEGVDLSLGLSPEERWDRIQVIA